MCNVQKEILWLLAFEAILAKATCKCLSKVQCKGCTCETTYAELPLTRALQAAAEPLEQLG